MSSTQQLLLGEGAGGVIPAYIEEVFSTQVYTGAGTSNTILNYIDLATKGGLVWTKMRASPGGNQHDHRLSDSAIGVNQVLSSNNTNPKTSSASFGISAFNSDGYTITNPGSNGGWNFANDTFVSWTFRKQPKFFDIVTWSGNNTARTIAHNLGSTPGCIIVKCTNTAGTNWAVYHRSLGNGFWLKLESAGAALSSGNLVWTTTEPTSTEFSLGGGGVAEVNKTGSDYVAYLFAHNAGGFGAAGTDNVISCGSYAGNGSTSGPTVNLGYEPQWVLIKSAGANAWNMVDNMRGWLNSGVVQNLQANAAFAESQQGPAVVLNSTGFRLVSNDSDWNGSATTYTYIAIRRGPMKVPTNATTVFSAEANVTSDAVKTTTGFVTDMFWERPTYNGAGGFTCAQRLTQTRLVFSSTAAEGGPFGAGYLLFDYNNGFLSNLNGNINPGLMYGFQRAPSFCDVVCYTGTGVAVNQLVKHNLTVQPQLLIVKVRSTTGNWNVDANVLNPSEQYAFLNLTNAFDFNGPFAGSTATEFYATSSTNTSGQNFIAYLFATCAGVSKVGSYTGTGATQTIDCGFTTGARFVLIKITNTTGNWFVFDTARGMTVGTNPSLTLNSTAAQDAGSNISTTSVGFTLAASPSYPVNSNGYKYLFLAIA